MEANIRKLSFEDINQIKSIREAISGDDDIEVDFHKLLKQHISNSEDNVTLVAEAEGKVVGFMMSTILYAGFGIRKSAWIMSIGIHPDFMGRGLGLKLAEKICETYREKGVKSIYSSVLWDSIDLLSFFKKLGFHRSEFINLKKNL